MLRRCLVLLALLMLIFTLGGCDDSDELPIDAWTPPGAPGSTCADETDPCCVGGKIALPGVACDDSNDRTGNDACDAAGNCVGEPCECEGESACCDGCFAINNGGACEDDGTDCTVDACDGGQCTHAATPGTCFIDGVCYTENDPNPENPCQFCNPLAYRNAWSALANGAACEDGNWCTAGDTCLAGVCNPGNARDCGGVVTDGQCQEGVCDEAADACVVQNINEDQVCNDGLFCTVNDVCQMGVCAGSVRDCDGNIVEDQCQDAFCDEDNDVCQVVNVNQGQSCDDGLFCTVADACNLGACVGTGRDCRGVLSEVQCQVAICDDELDECQAQVANNGGICNDGDLCTGTGVLGTDTCHGGVCGGLAKDCTAFDGPCTQGVCDQLSGACEGQAINEGGACDDGTFCMVDTVCVAGICEGGTLRDCSDQLNDPFCEVAQCDPVLDRCDVDQVPNGSPCEDDQIACTNDVCNGGICDHQLDAGYCWLGGDCVLAGVAHPDNVCLECDPASPNTWTANADPCEEDGILCTQDVCEMGVCNHDLLDNKCYIDGVCFDDEEDNPDNLCQKCDDDVEGGTVAWTDKDDETACDDDDGNDCTAGFCYGGVCNDVAVVDNTACQQDGPLGDYPDSDNNDCTEGLCTAGTCVQTPYPNDAEHACDDDIFCTINTICIDGVCGGGDNRLDVENANYDPRVNGDDPDNPDTAFAGNTGGCDDADPCTVDTCDNFFGCIRIDYDCDTGYDEGGCTWYECEATELGAAACVMQQKDVDDDNECTVDTCEEDPLDDSPDAGIVVHTIIDAEVVCDDSDPCTVDECDAAIGCYHATLDCTIDDDDCQIGACDGVTGECVYTWDTDLCPCRVDEEGYTDIACDDGIACTTEVCDDITVSGVRTGTECNVDETTDDAQEDNDLIGDAVRWDLVPATPGLVSVNADADWYYVNACENGKITATLTYEWADGNLTLALYSDSSPATKLESANGFSGTETFTHTTANSEAYYVVVEYDDAALVCNNYELTVAYDASTCDDEAGPVCNDDTDNDTDTKTDCLDEGCMDPFEAPNGGPGFNDSTGNDDWDIAKALAYGDMPFAAADLTAGYDPDGDVSDEDWYEIPICEGYDVVVDVNFDHDAGDIDIYLQQDNRVANDPAPADDVDVLESDGGDLARGRTNTDNESLTWPVDKDDGGWDEVSTEWYLEVLNDGSVDDKNCTPYDISIELDLHDDAYEDNDTQEEAVAFDLNTTKTGLVLHDYDSVDWWVSEICVGGRLLVTANYSDANMHIAMYNANGDLLTSGTGTTQEVIDLDPVPATLGGKVVTNMVYFKVTESSLNDCERDTYSMQVQFLADGCEEDGCGDGAAACCSDSTDNDLDTLVDCADPDCWDTDACNEAECGADNCCTDGTDNDLDTLVDCMDPDCDDTYDLDGNGNDGYDSVADAHYTTDLVTAGDLEADPNTGIWAATLTDLIALDQDHYEIPVCDGAVLDVAAAFTHATVDVGLYLYKWDNAGKVEQVFHTVNSADDNEALNYTFLFDGVVYLVVDSDEAMCGGYGLDITIDPTNCEESADAGNCSDGLDNDLDGDSDGADPDCP